MDSQLDKLDFLMQAMIKTSRLEAGVIALEPKPQAIYDTLAAALGGILLNAEQKKIAVTVDARKQQLRPMIGNGQPKPCSTFWIMR